MNHTDGLRHLLIRAQPGASALYTRDEAGRDDVGAFTRSLPADDPFLGLSDGLAGEVEVWFRARPQGGSVPGPEQRRHARDGLAVAQSLAAHLGSQWMVRYWDEAHGTVKVVCWGCRRLHWILDEHGTPPHPVRITVEAEFKWYPLRAEGFGDFAPDDPAAALHLSDGLVEDLYQWAKDFDAGMNQYVQDRDEDSDDARRRELDARGGELAERVSRETGPGKTVTYGGLA
jgi:hypothetical protein